MKIKIEYNSSWQGKLLENNKSKETHNLYRERLKEGNRERGTMFPERCGISYNTVLGILYRLIGEVRPLWMILEESNYFSDFINDINWKIFSETISRECLALRYPNTTKTSYIVDNPNSWTGFVQNECNHLYIDPRFYQVLCFPLTCNPEQLYDLIVNLNFGQDYNMKISGRKDIRTFVEKCDSIKDISAVYSTQQASTMLNCLIMHQKNGLINPTNYQYPKDMVYSVFVASAMHLSFCHLKQKYQIDSTGYNQPKGKEWHKGISPRGANKQVLCFKDFVASFVSGGRGSVVTYPVLNNYKKQSEKMKKSDGILEINIDCTKENGLKLKDRIENANVGIFKVGKKGTARVLEIRV